jgi:hypothetical protein
MRKRGRLVEIHVNVGLESKVRRRRADELRVALVGAPQRGPETR